MILRRLITIVMALSLAFSVSAAMASKGGKNDRSGKGYSSGSYSQKDDRSGKGGSDKSNKSGKSGRSDKSDKSDKSDNSRKSGRSGKSGKSGKSEKPPVSCVSDWQFIPGLEDESGFVESGVITGTACTEDEVLEIAVTEFSPSGAPDTVCLVDDELSALPDVGVDSTYELNLILTCNTSAPPPPPPPAD